MALTIGVDVGGTKVAAGVVDENGTVLARARWDRRTPTARRPRRSSSTRSPSCGPVTRSRRSASARPASSAPTGRRCLFAPNLAWRQEPLKAAIEQQVGLPTVVENDANAAAWAEARFGAGAGESHVVVVTVGTGIGGGIVLDGRLQRGRFGLAAEIGHLTVVPDGRRCGCGNQGCWEQYSSGRALVAEARRLAEVTPGSAALLLDRAGGKPSAINGPMVTAAAVAGDEVAIESFKIIGTWLGRGIADLAAVLDPGVFVIAGGVSVAGDLLREPAWQAYLAHLSARAHRPAAEVRIATLGGDEAGIIGAADLARQPQ